ncbi:MAG: DUF3987 domain-containing protein [Candidatus Thiodiazotropha sp.]
MYDPISQFRNAIKSAGMEPPEVIEPGKVHRFPGVGKSNGNTAGWCRMFDDAQGGCFGDWSSEITENWKAKRDKPPSPTERMELTRQINETKQRIEAKRQQQYADATAKAMAIWNAAEPVNDDHPYLIRKGIKASGSRLYQSALVIPVWSGDELLSLQFIAEDGSKRFLKNGRITGGCFIIGNLQGLEALCIAEGFATGATIHQSTGFPVAVAFNAGNLEAVARAMCQKLPDLPLIICADDDAETDGNPGVTKANKAAQAIGAKMAVPDFGDHRPRGVTDFNDMAALLGLEAVTKTIRGATKSDQNNIDGWSEPLPLTATINPEPYPLDALPESVRAAVEEVHAFTKAPIPLVASSALAAMSLSVQAHADVKRAEKLQGPSGLFLLTIADSGERKSTCDSFFMQAIRDYEAEQLEAAKPMNKDHKAAMDAWEAKRSGLKDKIRQLAKTGKPTHEEDSTLFRLQQDKPEPPRVPRLLYADATPEALKWCLAKDWPTGGVVSSEAGLVFGAHGMGRDSIMRNLATLNQLWDGQDIATERRTTESFIVHGARLTIALQVQEATLRDFFDRSGGLARGTGFLARFLVAWPESTQGYRPFSDPPESWHALALFNQRIAAILNQAVPIDDDGSLTPPVLSMTAETKAAWVMFHDAIEIELRSGGELYNVRDVASKTADNAARIATLFEIFEHGNSGAVVLDAFEGASRIAAWHLHEARRFYGDLALPEEQVNAVKLDNWLLEYCRREKTNTVPRRQVQRYVTPGNLRQKTALDNALSELEDAGRVRLIQYGRRKEIHVHPVLIEGDE